MSWNDFYRRRDVIDAVLRRAERDPHGALPFAEVAGAREAFGSEENLLLALQYKWTQVLSGRLRSEVAGPEDADGVPGGGERDHVDAVSRAWRAAVREQPTLRAVLEAHAGRYASTDNAHEAELRMLAVTAGLAEPNEPRAEVTRIGQAFVALLEARAGSRTRSRRANPVGQLLRRLAPTA
ncbi:hypothetical protein [Prauserella cavernicola]|uniref:Uncharacterized protein n=1 Tax=Prauserella cavernicola TaxID=2800127 RepID=A0A934QT73_9PSEU|nr:hypothetical protein [Prauserella cavernicola]MBK1786186.1 hypothetical protein [Prauserella cavernicola]